HRAALSRLKPQYKPATSAAILPWRPPAPRRWAIARTSIWADTRFSFPAGFSRALANTARLKSTAFLALPAAIPADPQTARLARRPATVSTVWSARDLANSMEPLYTMPCHRLLTAPPPPPPLFQDCLPARPGFASSGRASRRTPPAFSLLVSII